MKATVAQMVTFCQTLDDRWQEFRVLSELFIDALLELIKIVNEAAQDVGVEAW